MEESAEINHECKENRTGWIRPKKDSPKEIRRVHALFDVLRNNRTNDWNDLGGYRLRHFEPQGIILLQGDFYLGFKTTLDVFGLLFVVAVVLALARRLSFKPYFMVENKADRLFLVGMLYMGVSGFVQEGLRLALIPVSWAYFSPIGSTFAAIFTSVGVTPSASNVQTFIGLYQTLWWVHALMAFALIASIPYTKLFHVPNAIVNMMLYDEKRPLGKMTTPFSLAEVMKQQEANPDYAPDLSLGITTTNDLKWSQRIMLDSCTNCGRCEAACPANAAGRDLSPRSVVQDLKNRVYSDHELIHSKKGSAEDLFASGTVRVGEMYSCVMCAACVYECPVEINQVDFIADLRRTAVATNKIDPQQTALLSSLAAHQNPYGVANSSRADWARGSQVKTIAENPQAEYLYWVGCVSFIRSESSEHRKILGEDHERGWSFVCDSGLRGNVQWRSGKASRGGGEVPGIRHSEHCHNERPQREEGCDKLPPLFQHDKKRISGIRRQL